MRDYPLSFQIERDCTIREREPSATRYMKWIKSFFRAVKLTTWK